MAGLGDPYLGPSVRGVRIGQELSFSYFTGKKTVTQRGQEEVEVGSKLFAPGLGT